MDIMQLIIGILGLLSAIAMTFATITLAKFTKQYAKSTKQLSKSTSIYTQITNELLEIERLRFVEELWTYINPDKEKSGIADELIYENHLLARLAKSRKKEPSQTDSPLKKAYEEMNKLYEAMYKNDTELEQLQVASYKQKLNEKIGKIYKNQVSRFINDIEASSTDEN